ncbi:class I SAM-dependent methyltransferase [Saccharopolyspora sp. NPDC047091]|uniref:class I SAM-dependent methyltransferase n=1 Tax=Saccharopolyspora sp. NPDC047091 TaxID=3155924 RepID=UPI003403A8ED
MPNHPDVPIDPSNAAQSEAWGGEQGEFWAERAERFDEGVAAYHDRFLEAAGIGPAARVLDVGCGSGQVTRDAARRAAEGWAHGVDLSAPLVESARRVARREGVSNASFERADAQVHPFPTVDLLLSRHGAMFFGAPREAFAHLGRVLAPGGGMALLTWQPARLNPWMGGFRSALSGGREGAPPAEGPGPLSMSDPGSVRTLLESAGFERVRLEDWREPMYFGRDAADACRFVTGQFAGLLAELDVAERDLARQRLLELLAEHESERGVLFESAAWLVRAKRP